MCNRCSGVQNLYQLIDRIKHITRTLFVAVQEGTVRRRVGARLAQNHRASWPFLEKEVGWARRPGSGGHASAFMIGHARTYRSRSLQFLTKICFLIFIRFILCVRVKANPVIVDTSDRIHDMVPDCFFHLSIRMNRLKVHIKWNDNIELVTS